MKPSDSPAQAQPACTSPPQRCTGNKSFAQRWTNSVFAVIGVLCTGWIFSHWTAPVDPLQLHLCTDHALLGSCWTGEIKLQLAFPSVIGAIPEIASIAARSAACSKLSDGSLIDTPPGAGVPATGPLACC